MEMRPPSLTCTTYKNTFLHTIFPTKEEEDSNRWMKRVIEIRDVYPYQRGEWSIRKNLTQQDVQSGKIFLSHAQVFDHVLRFRTLDETASLAISGNGFIEILWDKTDEKRYVRYNGICLDLRVDEHYELACADLIRGRNLLPTDEIGLRWSVQYHAFIFKVLRRNVNVIEID